MCNWVLDINKKYLWEEEEEEEGKKRARGEGDPIDQVFDLEDQTRPRTHSPPARQGANRQGCGFGLKGAQPRGGWD